MWCGRWLLGAALLATLPESSVVARPESRAAIETMDALWSRRADPGPMEELIRVGDKALREEGARYEILWRVARGWWWIGHSAEDPRRRREICSRAREIAARAVELRPEGVEARLVYAFAVGDYATTIGVVRAVAEGIGSEFERAIRKAYELDRDHDDGAAIVALGRYYWMLPWPLRDLEESRRLLEEARERHPRNLSGRFYLAETYEALGEREAAAAELDFVIRNDPLPRRAPEDAPFRDQARRQRTDAAIRRPSRP